MIKLFNLKLHDDGAEVGGVGTTPAIDSQAPQIVLGKPEVPVQSDAIAPAATTPDPASEWNGIKEKYKDLYSADVKSNIDRRLKGTAKEKREMMAILDPLVKYFNLPDTKALKDFVHGDLMPTIPGYQLPAFDDQTDDGGAEASEVVLSPAELATQATALAETFADFDLEAELPGLQPLLGKGLSLEQAFKLAHFDQILQAETLKAAEAQKKATIEAIRTKGMQAVDEAVSRPAPQVIHKTDPSTWSDAELDKAYQDAIRGVKIKL